MKKFMLFLLAGMCAVFMISCQNENSSETPEDSTTKKIKMYKSVLSGTAWKYVNNTDPYSYTLSFTDSTITIDDTKYTLNLQSDLYFYDEIENAEKLAPGRAGDPYTLYILVNNEYLGFAGYLFDDLYDNNKLSLASINCSVNTRYQRVASSDSSSSGSGSGSGSSTSTETVTVSGSYSATGAQSGATTTFTDGTWKFSYMSSSKTGSYSQSGNELTINYSSSAGSYSAVFTVSKGDSDSIVKLTGKSGAFATVVPAAFQTTDSDALTKGNVTLTKN